MTEPMPGATYMNQGAVMANLSAPAVGGKQQSNPNNAAITPKKSNAKAPKPMVNLEVRRPPIAQSDRSTYVNLRKLVERTAQDAWNKLQEVVDKLADADPSDQKGKKLLADYAETYRRMFIKLLVITIWAANADKVTEIIDVNWYLRQMNENYKRLPGELFKVQAAMVTAKVENPDLETAMEVLSTGHPRIPAMDHFVPPPPMSNEDILRTFREINAHLSIRMGLHETLPKHFRDYRIASGRVTFTIPGEFEVDLSVGDEKMESQLYLIDVRPLYSPCTSPLPKNLFNHLENRANHILLTEKLDGLYKFLHTYFETAKTTELHRQVAEMARGRWHGHLEVRMIRRTLCVPYWIQRPSTGKSWIEVGSRRQPNGSTKLGVRWVREGQEVKNEEILVDDTTLSMETLMRTVIVRHIVFILRSIKDQLAKGMGPKLAKKTLRLHKHRTDPWKTHLSLDFSASLNVTVRIEPVTGRFAITGAPQLYTTSAEEKLNRDPKNAPGLLQFLRIMVAQTELEQRARYMGWETFRKLNIDHRAFQASVQVDVKGSMFLRRNGWNKDWWIVYVLADGGDTWWLMEMRSESEVVENNGRLKITKATQINIATSDGKPSDPTYQFLANLEKIAADILCSWINCSDLQARNVRYQLRPSAPTSNSSSYTSAIRVPDLWIDISTLLPSAWSVNMIKICYHGLSVDKASSDGTPMVTLLVCGRTRHPMTQLANTNLASTTASEDVSFHPQTGSYVIRLRTKVGDSAIPYVMSRLSRISKLIKFVTVIRNFRLDCTQVQLGRISFVYHPGTPTDPNPQTAEIQFKSDSDAMLLHLPPTSPLLRVHPHLQHVLNTLGLEDVVKSLLATAPLLTALDNLEIDEQTHILVRTLAWIKIEYRRTMNVVEFRLRNRKGQLVWYVYDPLAGGVTSAGNEERVKCEPLKAVWEDESGAGWTGLRTGAAAGLETVGGLVQKVHEVVMGQADGGATQQSKQ